LEEGRSRKGRGKGREGEGKGDLLQGLRGGGIDAPGDLPNVPVALTPMKLPR